MDKFNFKIIMYIISFIEIGVSLTIYPLVDYPLIFIMENLLIALCLSGTFTTIIPLFNKVFGNDYGSANIWDYWIFCWYCKFLWPFAY